MHYRDRVRRQLLQAARIKNPKIKSISAESFDVFETECQALLIRLVTAGAVKGSRLDLKPRARNGSRWKNKQNHNDEVSAQMLSQLSVVEGLLKRVNNIERGLEFVVARLDRD